MLLRRLTQHVKSQNWFAISIDFVIVVAGIFLGFELSAWNDARQERTLEKVYLERLASDLKDDVETFDSLSRIFEGKARTIKALQDKELDDFMEEDLGENLSNLNYTLWIALPALRRSTFDELVGSGNLTLLKQVDTRDALSQYYNTYELMSDIHANPFGDYVKIAFETLPSEVELTPFVGAKSWDRERVRAGLVELREHPGFVGAANSEIRYAKSMINWMDQFRSDALELVSEIDVSE